METIKLPCLKTLPTACMPTRATSKSVGLDLYSPTSVLIPAHDKVLVDLGIALQIPMGYYGRIAQMILEKVAHPVICEVSQMLPTERGAKGFGSTGQ